MALKSGGKESPLFVNGTVNNQRKQFALLNWTETKSTVLFIFYLDKKILGLVYHSLSANIKVITKFEHIFYQQNFSLTIFYVHVSLINWF